MFKYWRIKQYGEKFAKRLSKRYGNHNFYSASQIRATVYQCDFDETYLPLGYILYLDPISISDTISREFPDLCVETFKRKILEITENRSMAKRLNKLISST